jgi:hypothetical protein
MNIRHAYGRTSQSDWHVEYRVRVSFSYGGRVFREGDLVREDELPISEILDKKPDLLLVSAGRRGLTEWREKT